MKRLMIFFSALLALGFFATAAYAAELPSSSTATRPWLKMNPTTFAVSTVSVLEQFDRIASIDARLTPSHRVRLAAMLAAGEGVEVPVPDGTGFNYLTGRINGGPGVYQDMLKQLGRSHRALMFDLGDGVTLYWFTGEKGISCNNIGVVIKPSTQIASAPTPTKKKCRIIVTSNFVPASRSVTYLPGFVIPSCCFGCVSPTFIPGLLLSQKSSGEDSTTFTTVCQ